MKLGAKASLFILAANVAVKSCVGFQVDTQRQKLYKDAVEKATKKKAPELPPITIADDNSYAPPDDDFYEYWFDNRIHVFGNTGILGGLHAFVAPFATKAIDDAAYEGESVRTVVSKYLSEQFGTSRARILDLCCGVGISTRALHGAFPDAEAVVGLDTSPEMISMAKFLTTHTSIMKRVVAEIRDNARSFLSLLFSDRSKPLQKSPSQCEAAYVQGNAEKTIFHDESFDLVTVMYGFHEIPRLARGRILRETRRLLRDGGTLAVIDISTEYTPSETMLAGEPYVLEYKKNIHKQIESLVGFTNYRYETIVPGHVGLWLLTRDKKSQVPSHMWSI